MVTHRWLTDEDFSTLELSLALDSFHQDTPVSFFIEEGTVCSVYELDGRPVMFVRGKAIILEGHKVIQLDIQFVNNQDFKTNIKVMLEGFPALAKQAFRNGFVALLFESSHVPLRRFCMRRLGFSSLFGNWLIRIKYEDSY